MADWNKQFDIVGWLHSLFIRVIGSWGVFMFATFGEIKLLRKNLSKISKYLDMFESWGENDLSLFKIHGDTFWIRLDALLFRVKNDESRLRKLIFGGTKTVPNLYIISPADAEIVVKTAKYRGEKYGFYTKTKDGKIVKVDLANDWSWFQRLSDESSKAIKYIDEVLAKREVEKAINLKEAKKLMNHGSAEQRLLLQKWRKPCISPIRRKI